MTRERLSPIPDHMSFAGTHTARTPARLLRYAADSPLYLSPWTDTPAKFSGVRECEQTMLSQVPGGYTAARAAGAPARSLRCPANFTPACLTFEGNPYYYVQHEDEMKRGAYMLMIPA